MSVDRSYEDDFIVDDDNDNAHEEPTLIDTEPGETGEISPIVPHTTAENENNTALTMAPQDRPPSLSEQAGVVVIDESANALAHSELVAGAPDPAVSISLGRELENSVSYGDDFDEEGEVENEAIFLPALSPSHHNEAQEKAFVDASVSYGYDFDSVEPNASLLGNSQVDIEPIPAAGSGEHSTYASLPGALSEENGLVSDAAGLPEGCIAADPCESPRASGITGEQPSPRPARQEEGDGIPVQETDDTSPAELPPLPLPQLDSAPADVDLSTCEPCLPEGLAEHSAPLAAESNADVTAECAAASSGDETGATVAEEMQALESHPSASDMQPFDSQAHPDAIASDPLALPLEEEKEEGQAAEEKEGEVEVSPEPPQQPLEELGSQVFYDAVFQDQTRVVDFEHAAMPQHVPFAGSAVDETHRAPESTPHDFGATASSEIRGEEEAEVSTSPRMEKGHMNSTLSLAEDPAVAQCFHGSLGDTEAAEMQGEPLSEAAECVDAEVRLAEDAPLSESTPLRPASHGERLYEVSADSEPLFEQLAEVPSLKSGHASVPLATSDDALCLPDSCATESAPPCEMPSNISPEVEPAPVPEAEHVAEAPRPDDAQAMPIDSPAANADVFSQDTADDTLPPPSEAVATTAPVAPRKITLDMLERYVEPPRPRSVANLRNAVHSHRGAQRPKPRPKSATAAAAGSSSGPTFLTGLNEAVKPVHSHSATQLPASRPRPISSPSREATGAGRPASPSRGPIRYCHAIRFSVDNGWVVLSDVCPHRREFSKCRSAFCQEALEKSEWLNMMRRKSKDTVDLITTVDRMWRLKLHHALDQSVEEMRRAHAREMSALKKKLLEPNSQERHLKETLKYLQRNGAHVRNNEELYLATGLTSEHYEFVHKQVEVHQGHSKTYVTSVLDQHRAAHAKALEDLKQSIETPLHLLDSTRDAHLETVDFHMKRVERMIVYILDLTVAPSKLDNMRPPDQDAGTVARVRRASKQVMEVLRAALAAFAHLCGEIRRVYCNADQEVRRMLQEARSTRFQARSSPARASPVRAQSRGASAKRASSAKAKTKADLRPYSAPPAASMRLSQDHLRLVSMASGGGEVSSPGSYDSDFEEPPRASQLPRKISRATTATSIPEAVVGEDLEIPMASYSVAGTEVEEVHDGASRAGRYDDDDDDFVHITSAEGHMLPGLQDEAAREEGERRKPSRPKSRKARRRKDTLPVGTALKDELAVARLQDSKRNRKTLLNDLIGLGGNGAPRREPSPKRMSRLRVHLQQAREQGSSAEGLQDDKAGGAGGVTVQATTCFHCNQVFRGKGKTMPRLSDQGSDSWRKAQEDAARSRPRLLDPVKRVRLGAEVFDLSKTFLAKLQLSAERVVEGDPVFCSWLCVKKWAVGSCPIQHRYQTEMLINMAAGAIVEG